MKRKFRILAGIKWASLLLTVVFTVIWIGSLWFIYSYRAERWDTAIAAGRIQVGWGDPYMGGPGKWVRWNFNYSKTNGFSRELYWRFDYFPADGFGSTPRLWIPLWSFALLAAIPTGIVFTREALARRRFFLQGKCPHCKFDRSGLAPDAKCPECGKPASLNS